MKQYDIEVERVVIGDLLTFDNIQDKTLLIEAGDFEYEEHKEVFAAIAVAGIMPQSITTAMSIAIAGFHFLPTFLILSVSQIYRPRG